MRDSTERAAKFYWRWVRDSFGPAASWARKANWIALAVLGSPYASKLAKATWPTVGPIVDALPGWVPFAAFWAFIAIFGGRLAWWPYAQFAQREAREDATTAALLKLKVECLALIRRCKAPNWLQEKGPLSVDMKAYFDRAQGAADKIGQHEGLLIFDEMNIDPARIKPPGTLGGWVGDNFPKLVISAIRVDEFIAARRANP